LEEGPGVEGIADIGLILSAIGRPYMGRYRPLARKAAALVQSMASNHGFIDGNKRTTVILTHLLIDRSGYELVPLPGEDGDEMVENLVLAVVCRRMNFEEVVAWFKARLRR
jgi:death-on-curing protein